MKLRFGRMAHNARAMAQPIVDWTRTLLRNGSVVPWTLLAIGVLVSFVLYSVIEDKVETAAEERFDNQATETRQIIERRVLYHAEVLYGARALFSTRTSVTRLEFHRYATALELRDRFPGFDILNYAVYLRHEGKERFVESVRRDTSLDPRGYPDFAIKPPGDRPDYFVLVYVEPMAGLEFAFGLDIGTNPAVVASGRRAVANLQHSARDTGNLTASGLPIRIKAAKEYIGLAMRLPVYRSGMPVDTVEQRRAAYLGSVGAGFNVENLLKGVLDPRTQRHLRFRVYGPVLDNPAPDASRGRMLFDSHQLIAGAPTESPAGDPGSFTRSIPMEIAGRTWEIVFNAPRESIIGPLDRTLPLLVLAGGLLSSLLLFGVLHSLSSSRSRALKLAAQMTKDLRATSNRLVEVQESERRLLARELHDRVGQNLTALGLNLSIVANGLPSDAHPELAARLDDSSQLVQGTVDAMRDVMAELRPSALDDYGLPAALRLLAAGFSRRTGIQVAFEADEPSPNVPKAVDLAMYRIAQEALNNIAKHSSADRVEVAIRRVNGHATLSVRDNGVGIDPKRAGASNAPGWGLLIMRERAESVGAEFTLRAEPDAGVQVLVEYGLEKGA
jgi:signal transduction histidine kinase